MAVGFERLVNVSSSFAVKLIQRFGFCRLLDLALNNVLRPNCAALTSETSETSLSPTKTQNQVKPTGHGLHLPKV